ncbi:MAG: ROK family protein [Candidatus Aegiribacteria sp.]
MTEKDLTRLHWGIDIGGTTIILGYRRDGQFFRTAVLNTEREQDPHRIMGRVTSAILAIDPVPSTAGVGIAGLVKVDDGILVSSPNLPGWSEFPVGAILSEALNCPVAVDNDSNAFAVGAVGTSSIPRRGLWLMVTLGTGIGGTIISGGNILYGTGFAGEFGHMSVAAFGESCPCGSKGCWEQYAAAGALVRYYSRSSGGRSLEPREISELASKGDRDALSAFEEFGTWLGVGMVNLYNCFSPHGVFLAGGLTGASSHFLPRAESEFGERCGHRWTVEILPSSSDAGAEGAAILGDERS